MSLIERHYVGVRQRPRLIQRLRFQLAGGLIFCALLPALIRSGGNFTGLQTTAVQGAMLGAALAVILAIYLYRRLGTFPGIQAGSHILLSVTVPFALMAVLFVLARPDYSRSVFVGSYAMALLWVTFLHFATRPYAKPDIAIVPGGHADGLPRVKGANWRMLTAVPASLEGLQAVAADLRHELGDDWERFLAECALEGIPVYHSKQITESLLGRVEIEHLSENQFGSLMPNLAYLKLKGVIDRVLALLALPCFALLYAFVAPMVIAGSGWPVLHTQERIGYRGRKFVIYKFRTMRSAGQELHRRVRADTSHSLEPASNRGPSERQLAVTQTGDGRITRIGAILRRYRIDETPQIFNVLKGEMSWIGPRPEAVTLSRWYESELGFYPYRHIVKPGISGWAQVNQGHVTSPDDVLGKLQYDFFYIKYLSPWLDLLIVVKTVRTVLRGFGAK